MSIQQLLSLILLFISSAGIFGSLSLDLFMTNNAGPGLFPLIYSVLLAVCSVCLFLQGRKGEKIRLKALFRRPAADAVFFYLMIVLCFLLSEFLGLPLSLGLFSVVILLQQKKLKPRQIILFELLSAAVFYLLFVLLLDVPFEHGSLFR